MNTNGVNVNRETVVTSVTVGEGKNAFNIARTKNGLAVTFGKETLTIPDTVVGQAFLVEASAMLTGSVAPAKAKRTRRTKAEMQASVNVPDAPKRTRRTKAQIEADNAAEAALNAEIDASLAVD